MSSSNKKQKRDESKTRAIAVHVIVTTTDPESQNGTYMVAFPDNGDVTTLQRLAEGALEESKPFFAPFIFCNINKKTTPMIKALFDAVGKDIKARVGETPDLVAGTTMENMKNLPEADAKNLNVTGGVTLVMHEDEVEGFSDDEEGEEEEEDE